MGCWDEFCVICGGPPYAPDAASPVFTKQESPLHFPDFEWLGDYVGITASEEVISLGHYTSSGAFYLPDSDTEEFTGIQHDPPTEDSPCGIFCHQRCFRLLQQHLGYTLRFQDVEPLLRESSDRCCLCHLEDYTDYGGMEKYHSQDFEFDKLFADPGKVWMLRDPMECGENAERILGVWRPFLESGFKVARRSAAAAALRNRV